MCLSLNNDTPYVMSCNQEKHTIQYEIKIFGGDMDREMDNTHNLKI